MSHTQYPPRCSRNIRGQDPDLDALIVAVSALDLIDMVRLAADDPAVFRGVDLAWRDLAHATRERMASHGMDAFWESPTHRAWIGGNAPGTLRIKPLTQGSKHES